MLLAALVTMFCVFAILAWTAYALVRPFTHSNYHRSSERLWRPLD